jgi:hypothetical protein
MAVKVADLPSIVLERIEAAFPEPAFFDALETESWPDGALRSLVDSRLLQRASRSTSVLCDGCELNCCKPIVVRISSTNRSVRAFVNCDEEPDLGRILVPLERLKRYRLTLAMLATFIRQALGISSPSFVEKSKSIRLGQIKGRYGFRQVWIQLDDERLKLRVGRQEGPIASLIRWEGGKICIDRAGTLRLANRKERVATPTSGNQPKGTKQRQRKRHKTARNGRILREAKRLRRGRISWIKISEQIAQMDFVKKGSGHSLPITASTVRRIISAMMSG